MKRDKGKAMKMKAFFLTFVSWMDQQQQAEAQPRIAPSLAPGRPRPLEPHGVGPHRGGPSSHSNQFEPTWYLKNDSC